MYYFYFDASALVKRYTQETGSRIINYLFANVPLNRMTCLILGVVEMYWVCVRKKNDGRISSEDYTQSRINLNYEVVDSKSAFNTIPVTDSLVLNSITLIESHSLNSTDALVLRSALDLNSELQNSDDTIILVASDQRLIRAAQQESLLVFNPETDSQQTLRDWITQI
ncbi:type II toxin-antitoxin system VapC family toxin [Candidatus Poribacteria bacterium]|nr:type II toxin-antitoxin system VapC family toxin [Candidatus Poribacteria bacterium]